MHQGVRCASLDLHASLLACAFDSVSRTVIRFLLQANWQNRQFRHGVGIPLFQLGALLTANSRDERKVIVSASLSVAFAKPAANVAMLDRFGISAVIAAIKDHAREAVLDVAKVGGVFRYSIFFSGEIIAGRNDPPWFRRAPLTLLP